MKQGLTFSEFTPNSLNNNICMSLINKFGEIFLLVFVNS